MVLRYDPTKLRRRNLDATVNGFYPDDPDSFAYESARSINGVGTCNNQNLVRTDEGTYSN